MVDGLKDVFELDKASLQDEINAIESKKLSLTSVSEKISFADKELAEIEKILSSKFLGDDMRSQIESHKADILKDKVAYSDDKIAGYELSKQELIRRKSKIDEELKIGDKL